MPTDFSEPTRTPAKILCLGTSGPLDPALVEALSDHGVTVQTIAEDADPPPEVDVVLVLQPPSPLIGRCRGRWPIIVAVDDPRATDVLRLLRGGVSDVTRRPIVPDDLVSRIRRALARSG